VLIDTIGTGPSFHMIVTRVLVKRLQYVHAVRSGRRRMRSADKSDEGCKDVILNESDTEHLPDVSSPSGRRSFCTMDD